VIASLLVSVVLLGIGVGGFLLSLVTGLFLGIALREEPSMIKVPKGAYVNDF
jgi:hypothetical protein